MMTSKARLFGDEQIAEQMMAEKDPVVLAAMQDCRQRARHLTD